MTHALPMLCVMFDASGCLEGWFAYSGSSVLLVAWRVMRREGPICEVRVLKMQFRGTLPHQCQFLSSCALIFFPVGRASEVEDGLSIVWRTGSQEQRLCLAGTEKEHMRGEPQRDLYWPPNGMPLRDM